MYDTEDARVTNWRIEQLNRAGVAPEVSQTLALSHAELEQMLRAKRRGCDDETLLAIFEDLDAIES